MGCFSRRFPVSHRGDHGRCPVHNIVKGIIDHNIFSGYFHMYRQPFTGRVKIKVVPLPKPSDSAQIRPL